MSGTPAPPKPISLVSREPASDRHRDAADLSSKPSASFVPRHRRRPLRLPALDTPPRPTLSPNKDPPAAHLDRGPTLPPPPPPKITQTPLCLLLPSNLCAYRQDPEAKAKR